MAKTSLITKSARLRKKHLLAKREGRKIKFSTRVYNRCALCGRPRGYIRKFDMCRICVRQHASNDMIMGLRKASW